MATKLPPLPIPPAWPKQDRKLGLGTTRSGSRQVTVYEPDLGLQICELVAEGHTLKAICEDPENKFPHRSTFGRWLIDQPELRKAYLAARELSAFAFEDQALSLAREIVNEPGSSQRVRAFDIAMNQLRWSAAKRNPREYGERTALQVTVPIQINTGLDLGQEGASRSPEADNVYNVKAQTGVPTIDLMANKPEDEPLVKHGQEKSAGKPRTGEPPAAEMRKRRKEFKRSREKEDEDPLEVR